MTKNLNEQLSKEIKQSMHTMTALSIVRRNLIAGENSVTRNNQNMGLKTVERATYIPEIDNYIKEHIGFGG